ncbi:elongation factor 1 alpha [Vairimorpha apis BRL 01]|uniref:Elongation factor 1 alpha n=1 Tax=Vairimorpha apis BRL 01 TaxID=1037528 RepID=T0MCU7_9MICR|nr:elongation factor 1 alpha [Vairimorpha apis BRL 01]
MSSEDKNKLNVMNFTRTSKVHNLLLKKGPKDASPVDNPERVEQGDSAKVVLIPQKQCVMETAKDFPSLGRFALRDSNKIVAIGSIMEVCSDDKLINEYGVKIEKKAVDTKKKGKN